MGGEDEDEKEGKGKSRRREQEEEMDNHQEVGLPEHLGTFLTSQS